MNARNSRSWGNTARKILVAGCYLFTLILAFAANAAPRRFEMALFGSSDPNYTDLAWISPGQPQPAAPQRAILQLDGYYQQPNLASYLSGLGYDWSRIAATVIDEPYWWATGATNHSNPCASPGDGRINTISTIASMLESAATAVKSVSSTTRFWVNFSEPEIQWMQASCIFNRPYIDVISLDKYMVPFNQVQPYYNWLVANRSKNHQQLALVPGTFYRESPNFQLPLVPAGWLEGYFNYANELNSVSGEAPPMVWLIAGWPGMGQDGGPGEIAPGIIWRGIFYPGASIIAQTWQAMFFNPGLNSLGGYMEAINTHTGVVSGWAVDRTAVIPPYVDIWMDGAYVGGTVPTSYRSDIADIYGIQVSGWSFTIPPQYNDGSCHYIEAFAVAHTAETWNHNELRSLIGETFCWSGPLPTTPPTSAPTLRASGRNLSWSAVANASSYNIYKDGVFFRSTSSTSMSNAVGQCELVNVTVKACNAAGCGPVSNTVRVDGTPPGQEPCY